MAVVDPALLKMIGEGFVADAYAADGNHLRWMFDPRLGFPRNGFCLERRPALEGEKPSGVRSFIERFAGDPRGSTPPYIQTEHLSVRKASGAALHQNGEGVALDDDPLIVDLHGGSANDDEPAACWVRICLRVALPGGAAQADALYEYRGEDEVVDRARAGAKPRPPRPPIGPRTMRAAPLRPRMELFDLTSMLEEPETGRTKTKPSSPEAAALHEHLLSIDEAAYAKVTTKWLDRMLGIIDSGGITIGDLLPDRTVSVEMFLELRADQIDRVALKGTRARLLLIRWVRVRDYIETKRWEHVGCYAMATDEEDYVKRNEKMIQATPAEHRASEIVFDPMPHGAEPLDEPVVPPTRPPTTEERENRYFLPWMKQLEPWLKAVLAESAGGVLHQSEVSRSDSLDTIHRSGEPVPAHLEHQTSITIHPYNLLLQAATSFPIARLLALAGIDKDIVEGRRFDYRVRGLWDMADVRAWRDAAGRRFSRLWDEAAHATPSQQPDFHAEIVAAFSDLMAASAFVSAMESHASGEILAIDALAMGIGPTPHGLFVAPESVTATFESLGAPDPATDLAEEAIARISWPTRARSHVVISEDVPLGATVARDDATTTGMFTDVLNTRHRGFGAPMPVVPLGGATAFLLDRSVESGRAYRYGVSEVDPFGRWSPFTETTFAWSDDTEPDVPAAVRATLEPSGTSFRLAVSFTWRPDRFAAAVHEFLIGVNRPPLSLPVSRATTAWDRCARTPSGGMGAYVFPAEPGAASPPTHDGMTVAVSATPRTVTSPDGITRRYIDYVVTFTGIEVPRDALDAAVIWAGVTARRRSSPTLDSPEIGGPARAEQIAATPPAPPAFPPEPDVATFADALGNSSYTVRWDGLANVRYRVYRANERELVDALPASVVAAAGYTEGGALAARAAALRALAARPESQTLFQLRSELIPVPVVSPGAPTPPPIGHLPQHDWEPVAAGPRSFTDELAGYLRTLVVYGVIGQTPSGVPSTWPSSPNAFVAVRVPHVATPATPVVVRGAWQRADGSAEAVELAVAAPPTGTAPIAALEVYRTIDPTKAGDHRTMRPVRRVTTPVFAAPSAGSDPVARIVDRTIEPWRTYYYRVVARASEAGTAGTPSPPSQAVLVRTLSSSPPAAPVATSAVFDSGSSEVAVTFSASVPDASFGDTVFDVLHVQGSVEVPVARARASAIAVGPGYEIRFAEPGTGPNAIGVGSWLRIAVRDPAGNRVSSAPVTVT